MPLATVPESLYWYYVNERHSIYLKREAGLPKPWTDDPILQKYKFTNVFRRLDTGSKFLHEQILQYDADPALVVGNILVHKMFNWIGTDKLLGWITDWDPEAVQDTLTFAQMRGEQVFTGAHIVRSEFGRPKIDATIDVCSALWDLRHEVVKRCQETKSLEKVFDLLITVNYIGPFMSHEFVIDLSYTPLLSDATDLDTWSNAGPGAIVGLQRIGLPSSPPKKAVESMRYLLERSRMEWLHTPPWQLHQCEFALCEVAKYARTKLGEGRPRSTYPGI